jgi:hypothetical protein
VIDDKSGEEPCSRNQFKGSINSPVFIKVHDSVNYLDDSLAVVAA